MSYKILMKKNFPSGRYGMPILYKNETYRVPEGIPERVAEKAIKAHAAEKIVEAAKPEPVKAVARKSMTVAPENKSVAAPADKSTLD